MPGTTAENITTNDETEPTNRERAPKPKPKPQWLGNGTLHFPPRLRQQSTETTQPNTATQRQNNSSIGESPMKRAQSQTELLGNGTKVKTTREKTHTTKRIGKPLFQTT
jgi:hypothetical protein